MTVNQSTIEEATGEHCWAPPNRNEDNKWHYDWLAKHKGRKVKSERKNKRKLVVSQDFSPKLATDWEKVHFS